MEWSNGLCDNTEGRIIAIDGKTIRRSSDGEKKAIHIVNTWSVENRFQE